MIVVPAADEQDYIGTCLAALAMAREQLRCRYPNVGVRVVVVLDGCGDGTESIVGDHLDVETLSVSERCVGAARRGGVAYALAGASHRFEHVWIASTDADSRVPSDWLVGIYRFAEAGYHAVLGTVTLDGGLPAEVERQWFVRHTLSDGHLHVHGANMSFRADVYCAVGGWPPLSTGEDVELVRRLTSRPGVSIVRSAAHPVITSVRRQGRAPDGFSGYLRELAERSADQSLQASVTELRAPVLSAGRHTPGSSLAGVAQDTIPST